MLVSVSSFLPIIIVGPVSDVLGTTRVLIGVGVAITVSGILSIVMRGPLNPQEAASHATGPLTPVALDPVAVATVTEMEAGGRRAARSAESAAAASSVAVAAPPEADDGTGPDGPSPAIDGPEPLFHPTPDEHE
jgi:hypothetical protein